MRYRLYEAGVCNDISKGGMSLRPYGVCQNHVEPTSICHGSNSLPSLLLWRSGHRPCSDLA